MDLENKKATRQSAGEALRDLGKINKNIVVLDADVSTATKSDIFAKEFPDRFFDMGISEQDMISTAAGLASCMKIPFACAFSVFATGRAYDQIRNVICYSKLNVKICGSHAGITVGEDGATHQMFEDINLMRGLPNMKVFSSSDEAQTKWLIKEMAKLDGPAYIRTCRLKTPKIYDDNQQFEIGKGLQIGNGTDATIFSTGVCTVEAIKAKEELAKEGINVRVVDIHTIKPIDENLIIKCAKETKKLISVEDHSIIGGLGSAISDVLIEKMPMKLIKIGIKDTFGESGKAEDLMKKYEIDSTAIIRKIKE